MKVVIARGENGPLRLEFDDFIKSGLPLLIPSHVELKISSAISDGMMMHFIVDEKGAEAYGGGFANMADAQTILSEIIDGWSIDAPVDGEPKLPLGDGEPENTGNTSVPAGAKVLKVGKVYMIADADNNVLTLSDRENSFAKEVEAYEYMLKPKA